MLGATSTSASKDDSCGLAHFPVGAYLLSRVSRFLLGRGGIFRQRPAVEVRQAAF
jgi:hypothetical protein